MKKMNHRRFFSFLSIILVIIIIFCGFSSCLAAPVSQQTETDLKSTIAALVKSFSPTATPQAPTNESIDQDALILMLLQALKDSDSKGEPVQNSQGGSSFTTEQLQQLMIMLNMYKQPEPQPIPVADSPSESSIIPTVPAEPEPVDCIMDQARIDQPNTCSTEDLDPEFSIKIVWRPRIATHISGVAAKGYFVWVRIELTNLTNEPWDGLRASSFSLLEDISDTDASVFFPIHEKATSKMSKSYETNQLRDVIPPGQSVEYFLVFDVSKEAASQSLIFRAVDRSGRKSLMRLKLPLPYYIPVPVQ